MRFRAILRPPGRDLRILALWGSRRGFKGAGGPLGAVFESHSSSGISTAMITRIKKPLAYALTSAMAVGIVSKGDDGSPYRHILDDAFAIVMGATGPASLSDSRIIQNTITGDEVANARPDRTITFSKSSSTAMPSWLWCLK